MADPTWSDNLRRNVLRCLTTLSHGSTPFIATFVLVHLTAPAMASLGGSVLSSQTMLLGREYYQTPFSEKYLVLGPLAVHALAGTTKRLLSPSPGSNPSSKHAARPLKSLLIWTGYTMSLVFLPIHYLTHRRYPMSSSPDIATVGPAELDYEFVKTGLQAWPKTSWVLYGGLLVSVASHAVDGVVILWGLYLTRRGGRGAIKKTFRICTATGVILSVLGGLYVLANEPSMIFTSLARRFEAVLKSCWVYRL